MYAESEGHHARAARRILANWMFHRFERGIAVSKPAAEYAGRVWTRPLGESSDEEKANAYFERQVKYDPDLWIVEIEDRQGRNFVDEPVV